MDPRLPKFISDYPTGKIDVLGQNLRQMSRNESHYSPPLRLIDTAGVAAIIMPVSRRPASVRKVITQNMRLAEEFGLYLIILCSHECNRQAIERFARGFPLLRWAAIDGPFTSDNLGVDLATDNLPFSFPKENDLSAKRNFGLQLGRKMGWDAILYADDDRLLTKKHLLKLFSLRHKNAVLVMSSSRNHPDNSVVISAYRQAYGNEHIDSFMDSSASIVSLGNEWLGFYPHIYNEDWLFMLPYILERREVTWAGSVRQDRYNPFIEKRAEREEAGDLIAEGLMRLAMSLVDEYSHDTDHDLLGELVKRANKDFWEREILQRAIFIREMLERNQRYTHTPLQKRRIKSALLASLRTLMGNEDKPGLDPNQITEWVQVWERDLATWRALPAPQRSTTGIHLENVLRLMAIAERSTWHDIEQQSQPQGQVTTTRVLDPTPLLSIGVQHTNIRTAAGLKSTQHLMGYLNASGQSLRGLIDATTKLRYDRPIRSITSNKPVATIAIVVRMYEDPDSVSQSIKNIVAWNIQQAPIHCVIWIVSSGKHRRQLTLYREYLMARLMLETVGTNIRLLSCIGNSDSGEEFQKLMDELVGTTAMLYWKTAIDSVKHPVFITNSQNEILSQGILSDLLRNQRQETAASLRQELATLPSSRTSKGIETPEDRQAAELVRNRLLRQSVTYRPSLFPTRQLIWAMKRAKITLLELDTLHYHTQVHHPLGFDAFANVSQITCVLLSIETGLDNAKFAIEHALTKSSGADTSNMASSEIILIIKGTQPLEKLEEYRRQIVTDVLPGITVPARVFFASSIVPGLKNGSITQLNTCEVLIRYEHWLENHSATHKILWSMPALQRRPTITRNLRLSHAALRLVARATGISSI